MILVCNTKGFRDFTYGKRYEGVIDYNSFTTTNDSGRRQTPSINGIKLEHKDNPKVYYFLTEEEWREKKLKQLLDD